MTETKKETKSEAAKDRVWCEVSRDLIVYACDADMETVWERYETAQPQCGFGQLGLCCTICNMGPCRIDPFGAGSQVGVCGATADTFAARNLTRKAAAGSACHSDHGRHMAHAMLLMAEGEAEAYTVRDPRKLRAVAREYEVAVDGRSDRGYRQGSRRSDAGGFVVASTGTRGSSIEHPPGSKKSGADCEPFRKELICRSSRHGGRIPGWTQTPNIC